MGAPSSGKSHLLASMEKPLLVMATDPIDKMQPYFDRGELDPEVHTGQFGQPIRIVKSAATGNAIIQIESFYDLDPQSPTGMESFISRSFQLRSEVAAKRWASIAIDSWTNLEFIARLRRTIGPMAVKGADRDNRLPYNPAKDDIQRTFNTQYVHLPCNVGVSLHTTEKRNEEGAVVYRGIKCIGELKNDLPGVLGERYLATNVDGTTRRLDTKNVAYNCCTLIDAPNPCANDFAALYTNWIAKRVAASAAAQPAAEADKE